MHTSRFMNISESSTSEIHGFCDAVKHAYAAVVYLKTLNTVTVMLVAAKTIIVLASALTLPRLELCSPLLLSELIYLLKDALPDTLYETFYWTYSTI